MPAPGDPPVVDAAVLARLADDLGGIDDIVAAYLDALPRRCGAIAKAIADGDAAAVGRTAHTLRSASAFLGALPLAELSAQLEREADSRAPVPPERARQLARAAREVAEALARLTRPPISRPDPREVDGAHRRPRAQ
jgi:HPt (histidine-containing phosphotransfer) domain-containing protein